MTVLTWSFSVPAMRELSETEAKKLRAGDGHYTAYVGPPKEYDFMGATQFRLLCALGLRDHHRTLDFGCGSLRLGRLLIPYLQPGRYFGIEPNTWLIEDAISNQLGHDILRIKEPRFSDSDSFDAGVFATHFNFIVAQSIFSHAGPDLVQRTLRSFAEWLEPDGICLATFIEGEDQPVGDGWHYPHCVRYSRKGVAAFLDGAALHGFAIPWFHPRQTWFLFARDIAALPPVAQAHLLTGVILRAPEFANSVPPADAKNTS